MGVPWTLPDSDLIGLGFCLGIEFFFPLSLFLI